MPSIPPEPPRFEPVRDPRPADLAWPDMVWPVPGHTELVGRWVRLTPVDAVADAAALFAALDDDRVWEHLSGRPATAARWSAELAARSARGWQQWLVRAAAPFDGLAAGAVVGLSCYLDVSVADARLEIGSTAYRPVAWGTTVNPETKLLLLGYAFETLRVGRVQLKTDVRNVRSQQAIARLGARYEGTLRRYQRRADGTVRDTVLFSITVEDWPAVARALRSRLAAHATG